MAFPILLNKGVRAMEFQDMRVYDLTVDNNLIAPSGSIPAAYIEEGINGQFLHTTAGVTSWHTFTLANLPSGAENQILRVVGGSLSYQNQLAPSNLPDPVVDVFRHTGAAYNLPAAGVFQFDAQDLASADFTLVAGVIRTLVAGKYQVSVSGSFTVSDTTTSYKFDLRKNSVAQDSYNSSYVSSNGTYADVVIDTIMDMAANDTIDLLSTLTGAGVGQVVSSAGLRLVVKKL